jgi:hypothetical protein
MNSKVNAKQLDVKAVEDALQNREVTEERYDNLVRQFNTIDRLKKDYENKMRSSTRELKEYNEMLEASIKDTNKFLRDVKKKNEGFNQQLTDINLRHSIAEINDKDAQDKETTIKKEIINLKKQMSDALLKRKKYGELIERIRDYSLDEGSSSTIIDEAELSAALNALSEEKADDEEEDLSEEEEDKVESTPAPPVQEIKKAERKKDLVLEDDLMDDLEDLDSVDEEAEVTCPVCGEKNNLDTNKDMKCRKCGADLL